jgi:hypothetical protein
MAKKTLTTILLSVSAIANTNCGFELNFFPPEINCHSDQDCPKIEGYPYCSDGSIVKDLIETYCINPGTRDSICTVRKLGTEYIGVCDNDCYVAFCAD